MQAGFAGSFWITLFARHVQDFMHYLRHGDDLFEFLAIRVDIKYQVVGMMQIFRTRIPWIELDAAELDKIEKRIQIVAEHVMDQFSSRASSDGNSLNEIRMLLQILLKKTFLFCA